MQITSTHKGEDINLPNGQALKFNTPTIVPGWDEIAKNEIVAAWVRAKILVVSAVKPPPLPAVDQVEEDRLIAELATFGIRRDRRSTVDSLRRQLDEAKAEAAASSAENDGNEANA